MNYQIFDLKLKRLIQACKETGNFKKLAVVGFISTSNIIDEIALKLGMRPRNREKNEEMLFEYMYAVNEIFKGNLRIQIFNHDLVNSIKETELLFLRNRGDLPYKYIKKLINTYYELRKIDVPNLYKGMNGEEYYQSSNLYMLNFKSRGARPKRESSSKFKPMVLQKIKEQERVVQNNLQQKLDQPNIERAIFLKNIKETLTNDSRNRITFQGALKDNLEYEVAQNPLLKCYLLGVAVLSLCLAVLIGIEMFIFPKTMDAVSHLLLIFFGVFIIIVMLYKKLSTRR